MKQEKKQEEKCSGCTKLIVELQKVKLEILFYGEKVLQEELYKRSFSTRQGHRTTMMTIIIVMSIKLKHIHQRRLDTITRKKPRER
jgi:hypothetical protein